MNAPIFIPYFVTRSSGQTEPEPDFVCPHCGKLISQEIEPSGGLPFWAQAVLFVLFILLFSAFVGWAVSHTSKYEPYEGSFVQYVVDQVVFFWNLLKDVF